MHALPAETCFTSLLTTFYTSCTLSCCRPTLVVNLLPQPNLLNYSAKLIQTEADDVVDCLDGVQAVNSAENTPVAMSPVPVSTLECVQINRLESLAMIERRKALLAQEGFVGTLPMVGLASQA